MTEYHKIQTVFFRDPDNKFKTLLEGLWSWPEFGYLANLDWHITEKVDGTNIRVIWHPENQGTLLYRGKTDRADIPPRLLEALRNRFEPVIPRIAETFPDKPVVFYGEGYGDRIQKAGKLYRSDNDFVLFDVNVGDYEGVYLNREDVDSIALNLGIDSVPLLGTKTLHEMVEIVKSGFRSQWGDFMAEGVVARPTTELKTKTGKRIITKLKYKDFPHD